jgi:ABC-type nitrate/sulfonate/bicarbonate transport system substrate-binding protein
MTTTRVDDQRTLTELWYTRCPVPTASGLAFNLGWLDDEFAPDGLAISALQDAAPELRRHHLDHQLPGLFREGGNIPALVARASGAPTRLVGLTWIDEWQSILVRPDSGIDSPASLRGARVGIPRWDADRGSSIWRGMSLAGFSGALRSAGLGLADVAVVEVPASAAGSTRPGSVRADARLPSFDALLEGRVDAVYAKGALAAEAAFDAGLVVGIDLDNLPERRFRVNNGTPRPLTVHQSLLDDHPDLVARFLAQTLRASDWAAGHLDEVQQVLSKETGSGSAGVESAYRDGFHRTLHPDLSDERVTLLDQQKAFLLVHGFLAQDFELGDWIAREPIDEARRIVAEGDDNGR